MTKPRLLFVVESPFSERDRRRFGIDDLDEFFEVHVWDTTPLVSPQTWAEFGELQCDFDRLTNIHSLETVSRFLETLRPHAVVSSLGRHRIRTQLLHEARALGAIRAEFWLGVIPEDDLIQGRSLSSLLFRLRRQTATSLLVNTSARVLRVGRTSRTSQDDTPDIFFFAGAAARELSDQRIPRFIPVSSFDTETARTERNSPPQQTTRVAVYLDQNIGDHSDFVRGSYRSPAEGVRLHRDLQRFVRKFQDATGARTVVAPHPRAERNQLAQRFGGLSVSTEPTHQLIGGSEYVLAHCSTAISFAVFFRKPILLLSNRQLRRGWYGPLIVDLGKRLNVPIIDMRRCSQDDIVEAASRPVDEDAYTKYQLRYMDSGSSGKPLWTEIAETLLCELEGWR